MEEQGECMENRFRVTRGKHSSSSARRREMAQRGVELNLAGDTWEVGGVAMSLECEGWGSECSHMLCTPFLLLCCPAFPQK